MFESFTLSTNIAGDCEEKTNLPTNGQCGMEFSGITVFLEGMNGCDKEWQMKTDGGDGEFNGICYHVPYGENLFNS